MSGRHARPSDASNLADLLGNAATTTPDQTIVHIRADGSEQPTTYRELYAAAQRVSAALLGAGLQPGTPLLIALERSQHFLPSFWGALLAGLVPAPLASEPGRIVSVWAALDRPALLLDRALARPIATLAQQRGLPPIAGEQLELDGPWVEQNQEPRTENRRTAEPQNQQMYGDPSVAALDSPILCAGSRPPACDSDLAYLQFSSGSTGEPRGVELTHRALLANIGQIIDACAIQPGDVLVTWMPYYHDMGLIAAHLVPLALGLKQVKLDSMHFARRPSIWLEAAHRHRATLLTAAPFALALVTQRSTPQQVAALDLRSVRMLAVGAEPVAPSICRAFLDHLAPAGLAPAALHPVYGLAEASAGVTMSPLGQGLRTHILDRAALAQDGRAVASAPGPHAVELADVGAALPGGELRIVDERDQPLEDGYVGHIHVRGPQLMRGYHHASDPQAAFCDGWLRTGDLGFLLHGRLAVTGRAKDVIVVNGRKHHAADLEELLREVPGLNPSRVAVCGSYDASSGVETVLAFIAMRGAAWERSLPLLRDAARRLRHVVGSDAIEVLPLAARSFPRTTSGKLQRYRLRARYEAGEFAELAQTLRKLLAAPSRASHAVPAEGLERELTAICARSLGLDPATLGAHTSLFELGGTSLQLMELLAAVGDRFGVEPDPAGLRERPTVAGLADWLRRARAAEPAQARALRGDEPIAVVEMACRFPGADTPEQFWANLAAGVDSVRELPSRRRDGAPTGALASGTPLPGVGDKRSAEGGRRGVRAWGSLLDEVSAFDADFFGIAADEAATMDPQQRILLELAYEALERAGYAGARRANARIGVFIGVGEPGYQELMLGLLQRGAAPSPPMAVGNMRNLAAARIAHALDLSGPAIAIDTACSSSLVALHLASASLQRGECDLALVGGANLNLTDTPYRLLGSAGALSPTGRSRAFDDAADGFVPGEGAAIILLEPLARAQREHDQILGLVRGSAVNNDGRALSPMAPNPIRQAEALRQAYTNAAIDPATVSYIEAHGTGTPIGDPIEFRSLAQVFPPPADGSTRTIGSVKTNIGHLLNAAGMPALIKVLLMLRHRQIPPSLHYTAPSQRFDLASAGLAVNTRLRDWDGPQPLRAGISGFGFGGTNAHIIVEAAPVAAEMPPRHAPADAVHILPLSARTSAALGVLAAAFAAQLRAQPQPIADVYRSASLREPMEHRAALLIDGAQETAAAEQPAIQELARAAGASQIVVGAVPRMRRRRVVFLFPGQGAQYPQQGRALYQTEPVFRGAFDEAAQQAGPIAGRTLAEWCFGDDVSAAALAHTAVTQPLLVAFEVALARQIQSWGLRPDAVLGHSVGELAAACVAGALSLGEAMALASARGRLIAEIPEPGAMAAVFAPEAAVRAVVAREPDALAVAAVNGASQIVISGRAAAVERALERLARDGYNAVPLNDSYAFHSPLMQPVVEPLTSAASLRVQTPSIPLLSTVSLEWLRDADTLGGAYWAEQVVRPVLFAPAIERLLHEGFDTFVEIGPGSTLAALLRQILAGRELDCAVEPLLRRGEGDRSSIRAASGRLWVHGAELDLAEINGGGPRQPVALPTYPFERTRHWLPTPPEGAAALLAPALPLRAVLQEPALLDGQPVAEVALEPRGAGWNLMLRATDGSELLALHGLRFDTAALSPQKQSELLQQVAWVDAPPAPAAVQLRHWLLVPDAGGQLARELCARLQARGDSCALADGEALAAPFAEESYGVIFLADPSTRNEQEQPQLDGVLRLLHVVQALLESERRPAGLWVFTADAYATGIGAEQPSPEQALVAGLAMALPDQHPGFACAHIDLALAEGSVALAEIVLRELDSRPTPGSIAWRAGRRLTRSLVPLPDEPVVRPQLPSGRVVVILGGAGGVGATLARSFAAQKPTLALVGRSALDQRRAALLDDLGAQGAEARYQQADITDAQAVDRLVAALVADYGAIDGVVHAAGVVEVGSLQGKSDEQFAAVLAPKVRGTWLLARALARYGQAPAFFVACSSIAAVLPGLGGGIADYVAGSAFLDAFAAAERRAGRPMTALNWSAWADVGMAAHPPLLERLREHGLAPLRREDAARAFERALRLDAAQVVVAKNQEPRTKNQEPRTAEAHPLTRPPAHPVTLSPCHLVTPSSVERILQTLVAEALRKAPDAVPLDAPFLALGLDSLQAVDLVKRLERSAGVTLPLTLFFEFQTIRALAAHLAKLAPGLAGGPHPPAVAATPGSGGAGEEAFAATPGGPHPPTSTPSALRLSPTPGSGGAEAMPFPLTPPQLAFYASQQLYPDRAAFSLIRQTIAGPLLPELLQQAFAILLARHAMLRAQFEPITASHSEPRQRIVPPESLPPALWFELRDTASQPAEIEDELASRRFDLHSAPLFRVVLCRSASGRWELFLLLHHIIGDGWSASLLGQELWLVYAQLAQGRAAPALPPTASFADYVQAQQASAMSQAAARDREWWAALFRDSADALAWSLPSDAAPADAPGGAIRVVRASLDVATSERLRQQAATAGVSLFHLLLASYARCLAMWGEARAVAINVADSGRGLRLPNIERLVGCCADQIPLLLGLEPGEELAALASRVRDQWLAAQQHSAVSAIDLARLRPARRGAILRSPGAATFSFARFAVEPPDDCPVTIEAVDAITGSAATRLTLLAWELGGALHFAWIYPAGSFRRETIAGLAAAHREALRSTTPIPSPALGQKHEPKVRLPLSPAWERGKGGEGDPLVPARILTHCMGTPDAVAVQFEGRRLTYGELGRDSALLAGALRARGAGVNQPIGLLTLPGIATIVGIVGILRADATWLLLNTEYPTRRLREMVELAGAQLVLYQQETEVFARRLQAEQPAITLLRADDLPDAGVAPPEPAATPDDLAYIIFTSGSTGAPKGVPITHRAIANYITWLIDTFGYGPSDRLLQAAAISFGAAVSQILGPLCSGGTVVPLPAAIVRDPAELLALVERERPTIWRSVPSLWDRLLTVIERRIADGQAPPPLAELRWIGVGGEPLPASLVRRWMDIYGERQRIANHYGPSEATINATCYIVPGRPAAHITRIPIGQAIRNTVAYVLDEQGNPCPPGAIGELHIGGVCLSPGYLGRPDLTEERFLKVKGKRQTANGEGDHVLLPFTFSLLPSTERLYKTGDLVRALPDGNLEFVGRADDQIKIRGYRVEPGEIEATLHQHPAIARAAVCAVGDGDEHVELVAYLETKGQLPPDAEMRRWLMELLPPQMIPHRFQPLPALPTTPSGKIDRRQLAEWQPTAPTHTVEPDGAPPMTPTEQLLAEIWRDVLKLPVVGRDDNFFEIGGDSLLILQVLAHLKGRISTPPRAALIYQHSTLADLARAIDELAQESGVRSQESGVRSRRQETEDGMHGTASSPPHPFTPSPLHPLTRSVVGGPFPLSPAQSGFLLAEAIAPDAPTTWCARLCIDGPLDLEALQRALAALVERHPMLRTIFLTGERPVLQAELLPEQPLTISFDDLAPLLAEGADEAQLIDGLWQAERAQRFAIDRWPLLRMRVLRLAAERHVWLITSHHIIGDGWSAWLFGQELLRVYDRLAHGEAHDLPPLRASFRDYVALIEQEQAAPAAHEYWRSAFAAPYAPPVGWRMPPDRPDAQGTLSHSALVDAADLAQLRHIAAEEGVTLYILLLALFARQLRQLASADDLVIGTALSGRDLPLPDIERLFGCCATALPIRVAGGVGDFRAELRRVAEAFSGAYAHALPPSQIARLLPTHTPALSATGAQFFFAFVDFSALGPLASETLTVRWDESHTEIQPPPGGTDLLLTARPIESGLRLNLQGAATAINQGALKAFMDGLLAQVAELSERTLREQRAKNKEQRSQSRDRRHQTGDTRQEASDRRHENSKLKTQNSKLETQHYDFSDVELTRATVGALDAALIGYLPSSRELAALAGLRGVPSALREQLRALLFPGRRPRWLEALQTPVGRSGFICLPWFADELAPEATERLIDDVVVGAALAGELGARCVSLAGMIPSLTGYGFAVQRALEGTSAPTVTTGHATTVVAVVQTIAAALEATGRRLERSDLAVLGLGSIGGAVLALLLQRMPQPRRIVLCDAVGSAARLQALAQELRDSTGYTGAVEVVEAHAGAPDQVYEAQVIVGASSTPGILAVDRLRPGTIVVDDSFPPCLDTTAAIQRMRSAGDVLISGGGLLRCGPSQRIVHLPIGDARLRERIVAELPPGATASCQIESLLLAVDPTLPPTLGLVAIGGVLRYWDALLAAGFSAAPLHLRGFQPDTALRS